MTALIYPKKDSFHSISNDNANTRITQTSLFKKTTIFLYISFKKL